MPTEDGHGRMLARCKKDEEYLVIDITTDKYGYVARSEMRAEIFFYSLTNNIALPLQVRDGLGTGTSAERQVDTD